MGAIVLAAGAGRRFGTNKQFLELTPGTRLVDRAVDVAATVADAVVVVLPEGRAWDGTAVYAAVAGGSDRLASAACGLAALPADTDIVLVHDAAHALASPAMAVACVAAIGAGATAAVPWLEAADVIAPAVDDVLGEPVGRAGYGTVQVPMAFDVAALRAAHDAPGRPPSAVEDSALMRWAGHQVVTVPGEATNVHVVDEASLELARLLARPRAPLATPEPRPRSQSK